MILEEGVDIRIAQVLLGHASLRSTEICTHLTKPMCENLRNQLDPMFADLFSNRPAVNKSTIELADVVRRFLGAYQEQFGDLMLPSHHRALQDIALRLTETMGGDRYHYKDRDETFWCYHA